MECNFCNKMFSSKSSLSTHQKTTKYCLKIQGKTQLSNFCCEHCNKDFTSKQQLIMHLNSCKDKEFFEKLENYKNEYELKLKKNYEEELLKQKQYFENKIKIKDNEINILKQKIAELNGCLFTLKDDHETVKEIAKQPTNTINNTNNNILNITTSIDFDNIEKIKDVIDNDLNVDYICNGQKGIARFIKDKFLKDENGKLIYVCTDPSRQIFKYKDITGEIKKDIEAKKLTNYIVDGGLKKKTFDITNEWYKDDNGNINIDKFNILKEKQQSILKIKDDNSSFKKELASLTT